MPREGLPRPSAKETWRYTVAPQRGKMDSGFQLSLFAKSNLVKDGRYFSLIRRNAFSCVTLVEVSSGNVTVMNAFADEP